MAFPRVGSITIGSQGDQSARWPIRLHHRTYEVENGTILGVALPQCGDEKLFPQAYNDEVSAGGADITWPFPEGIVVMLTQDTRSLVNP